MNTWRELHFWILDAAFPLTNIVMAVLCFYGAKRSPRFRPFLILFGLSSICFLLSQTRTLLLAFDRFAGIQFVPRNSLKLIWPFSAVCEYLGIALNLVGTIIMVRLVTSDHVRRESQQNTAPNAEKAGQLPKDN
jgi:hypothetical protein